MAIAHFPLDEIAPVGTAQFVVAGELDIGHFGSGAIYVDVTLGDLDALQVKVEFSNDGVTWRGVTSMDVTPPNATLSAVNYRMEEDGNFRIELDLADEKMRVSVLGVGEANDDSSVDLHISLLPA